MIRKVWLICLAVVLVLLPGAPADAGGSWFHPVETDIEPGSTVTMVGFSGFASGEPGDSFYGYLDLDPATGPTAMDQASQSGLLALGELTITEGGPCCWANYRLHVTFTLPADLAPGYYEFLHCNDPCTTNFGELIAGGIKVGDGGGGPPDDGGTGYEPADRSIPAVAELVNIPSGQPEVAFTG